MDATQNSEQTFVYNGNRSVVRLLLGVSAFSGLTLGLGLTGTHLLNPSGQTHPVSERAAAPMVPVSAKKIATFIAAPAEAAPVTNRAVRAEPKTARLAAAPAHAAAVSQPLSADAFERRFAAPVTASALPQPQRFASRLLDSPRLADARSAFTARDTDAVSAMNAARAFRLPQQAVVAAAEPAPAEAKTVLAMVAPVDLPRMLDTLPRELEAAPTPAPKRLPDAAAKPDPRSAGKLRKPAETAESEGAERAKPALRPGKSAKAPVVVASLPIKPDAPAKPKSLWQALGFARPDNPDEGRAARNIPWPGGAKRVAYYDISAQKVYMPNGETMEAHSGQGSLRDNPAYVHVKMRGATPPSTYRLSMRETLFHGVQALRLTPVDGVNPHGRVGLLTHSYLRRVPGDSAGCIVFKNYPRFLAAYKQGKVDHVVVVSSMSKAKAMQAKFASVLSRTK